jgi:hypothetical protein
MGITTMSVRPSGDPFPAKQQSFPSQIVTNPDPSDPDPSDPQAFSPQHPSLLYKRVGMPISRFVFVLSPPFGLLL